MVKTTDIRIQLFCDLDGVLADFDKGVKKITGKLPNQMPQSQMWPQISDQKIVVNSPHHAILHIIANEEALNKDLRQRTRAIRLLSNLGLLDQKHMTLTNKGFQVLFELDAGKDYIKKVNFYNQLDWMPDGKILWEYISKFEPVIITGLPAGDWAGPQKKQWVARELGPNIPVLIGMARDKAEMAAKFLGIGNLNGSVLIDDRPKYQTVWENSGGVWITHINADSTISSLRKMGL